MLGRSLQCILVLVGAVALFGCGNGRGITEGGDNVDCGLLTGPHEGVRICRAYSGPTGGVLLYNFENTEVSLSGWKISRGSDEYTFPADASLESFRQAGVGTATLTFELASGDVTSLKDDTGAVVDQATAE